MLLLYFWLTNMPTLSILAMFSPISSATVTKWHKYFNELIEVQCHDLEEPIGGPGIVVEVDESKFGKRKYHRGKRVDGVWVVGGVERTPERRIFMVTVADRSETTLESIIHSYVAPGSIVNTDMWKAYTESIFEEIDCDHDVVNHSKHFKDPTTGVHTNTIEGTWSGIKEKVKKRNRGHKFVNSELMRFIWDRQNKGNRWCMLMLALKCVVYESEQHFV
jgi:hypothetical protein